MGDRVRCVNKNRYFAWLEFEDMRDGIAFSMAFQGMGWQNLLHKLDMVQGSQGQATFVDENRGLQARVFSYQTQQSGLEQGVLWIPGDADSFTRQWVRKPGATSDPQHTLVFGSEATAEWADLLVISGHGSKGRVYGQAYGRLMNESPPGERKWYVANIMADRSTPRGKRLKYLMLPCCSNAGIAVAPMWLGMFRNRPASEVLHGILGYAQGYPGDDPGANIMREFVNLLFPAKAGDAPPPTEKTILECWALANKSKGGPGWGAVMIEDCAKQDKMSVWVSDAGLPDPGEIKLKQYDAFTTGFPLEDTHGIPVTDAPPDYEARFHLSKRWDPQTNLQKLDGLAIGWDGFEDIQCGNNDNYVDPQLGLDAGRVGKLVLSAKSGKFVKGTTMTVVFYLYREAHADMDLSTLLDLKLSASQKRRYHLLHGANRRKADSEQGKADAFHYVFDDGDDEARWELAHGQAELLFQVHPKAPDLNKDRTTGHSCGYFWLDVVPPRKVAKLELAPPADMPQNSGDSRGIGNHLKTAIHLVPHGVHLHRQLPSKEDLNQFQAAYTALRAEYEKRISVG